ncbi:MAG TPA: hypothetical protein VFX59_30790 [Polyangiales bacterium]|nr:hypothetical protein [Polyangiales bacterium]
MIHQAVRFVLTFVLASLSASITPACADGWTVRTARLVMPYGMRVPKHFGWYRDVTRAQREARKGTVLPHSALSTRSDPLAILNEHKQTSDRYRERGYAAFAEYTPRPGLAVGLSGLITLASADRLTFAQEKTWHRAESTFVRARLLRTLSVQSELELAQRSRRARAYAAVLQLDYEPRPGLHLMCSGELAHLPAENDVLPGGWMTIDWLVSRHFEVRFDAIARRETGSQLLARLNTYF